MVIHHFHVIGVATLPFKTNPPLVVDANAILTGSFAGQFLQAIGRWHAEVAQGARPIQHPQLTQRYLLYVLRQLARELSGKYPLGFSVLK